MSWPPRARIKNRELYSLASDASKAAFRGY